MCKLLKKKFDNYLVDSIYDFNGQLMIKLDTTYCHLFDEFIDGMLIVTLNKVDVVDVPELIEDALYVTIDQLSKKGCC